MLHVLLLEDHDLSRINLEDYLTEEGFAVSSFADGQSTLRFLAKAAKDQAPRPQLAILDRSLPDMDGLEVLRAIRSNPEIKDMPILMVTAKHEELERILGLEMGADDYVAKPFSSRELLARIRAVTRRSQVTPPTPAPKLSFGPITMDLQSFVILVGDEPIQLTRRESELLEFFLRHPGQVITRQQLLKQVWKYEASGDSRTIDVHMRRLRSKLGDAGALITTLVGRGYKLG